MDGTDRCIGDDDVQPSQVLDAFGDGSLQPIAVADIDRRDVSAASGRLDHARRLRKPLAGPHRVRDEILLPADIDCDDVGAFGRHGYRVITALALRRAGNQHNFSLHSHIDLTIPNFQFFAG
ncbi:hypothetical protein GCM10027068_49230 [Prescottella soli]